MSARLFSNMTAHEYHSDPCLEPSLSSHVAELLVRKSPRHAWLAHPRLGGVRRPPSKAMDTGTLIHALVLGKGAEIVTVDAPDWRTKAAQQARDDARAQGKTPVLTRELLDATDAAEQIILQLRDFGILLTGQSEAAVFWQEKSDDGRTVYCRGMVDHLLPNGSVFDLKTARSAHPAAARRSILDYGYYIQAHAYQQAMRALGHESPSFIFGFVELEPAVTVLPVRVGPGFAELGARDWRRAVNLWATCLQLDSWPGYAGDIVTVDAPPWALLPDATLTPEPGRADT